MIVLPLILDTLTWKTSLLVRSEFLGLFGNTLTTDHMYSRHYLRQISAEYSNDIISKTKNIFLNFLLHFHNLHKIFDIFEKNISFIA